MSNNHLSFLKKANDVYTEEFIDGICKRLSITENGEKRDFRDCVIDVSVNYLDANELNTDRIPAHKQKKILESYRSALKNVRLKFKEIKEHDSTNSRLHGALKEEIKKAESKDIEDMFSPYMQIGKGDYAAWSRSEAMFEQFIDTLIKAAKEASSQIEGNYKTSLRKEHIIEWVTLMRKAWIHFTDVNFGLGDWLKSSELGGGDNEKGMYKSECVDVLHDLISVVDKKITRSDIEVAVRKIQ